MELVRKEADHMTSSMQEVLTRVLFNHQMSIRINSRTGTTYCECGAALPCSDPLDEEIRSATHRSHIAAEQGKTLREWMISEKVLRAAGAGIAEEEACGHCDGTCQSCSSDAKAALTAVCDYGTGEEYSK